MMAKPIERIILYFAWVREQVGVGEERVALPEDVATLADLATWLCARGGGYATAFANPSKLRAALDQEMVPLSTEIINAREIAFFPPVTGG
jgi:molybdopterin synthase sulfur carrier subunit